MRITKQNTYGKLRAMLMGTIAAAGVVCAAATQPAIAAITSSDEGTHIAFSIENYQDFLDVLDAVNPSTSAYADDNVLITLQNNLDVTQATTLALSADSVTGATLAIARSNITIDGNNKTMTMRGYPTFNIEGARNEADALTNIAIKNITIDGAGYQAKPGGGMFFENIAYVSLDNCTFLNCFAARTGGGALYAGPHGGSAGPTVTINNCTFNGCYTDAGSGGAILGQHAKLNITNSTFLGNHALNGGAIAICGNNTNLTVNNTFFSNNSATNGGGALNTLYGIVPGGRSNVVTTHNLNATLTNCTFGTNTAGIPDTANYVFSSYFPETDTNNFQPATSSVSVNGNILSLISFIDPTRSAKKGTVHQASTYEELRTLLGYIKYDVTNQQWGDGSDHPAPEEGTAQSGDIIVITADLTADTQRYNPSATPRTDAITGATLFVTKDISIRGDSAERTIDGNGFPIFDIDGGEGPVAATITNLTIYNGAYNAKLGGAVFVEGDGTLNLYDTNFYNCTAGYTGDLPMGGGGAIYLDPHGSGNPVLNATDSSFINNKALCGTGGAISSLNGSVFLTNCILSHNTAQQGGALGMKGVGTLTVTNSTFNDNQATYGGAVDVQHGISWYKKSASMNKVSRIEATFTDNTFADNVAEYAENVIFSRYYDDTYTGSTTETTITWTTEDPEASAQPMHEDLTFDDVYRTILEGQTPPIDPPTSKGSSSDCNSGIAALALLAVLPIFRNKK